MCRSCKDGKKRCQASDSSENRRYRRKAAQAISNNNAITPNRKPEIIEPKTFLTIEDIQKETSELKKFLHLKPLSDESAQDAVDNELEKRVTAVGIAIANEAEKRAELDLEAYKAEYDATSDDLDEATMNFMESEEVVREATEALETAENTEASPDKIVELKKVLAEAEAERVEFEEAYSKAAEADDARREVIHSAQIAKLTAGYVSVLADIRELGGTLETSSDSSIEGAALLQDSVGKIYPSEWLEASNSQEGLAMRIKVEEVRSYYMDSAEQKDIDPETHPDAVTQATGYYIFPLKHADAETLVTAIGGEAHIYDGREVLLNDEYQRIVKIPVKTVFDPNTHSTTDGKTPSEDGWTYEHYIKNEKGEVFPDKVWVKEQTIKKVLQPEIVVSLNKNEREQKAVAYHEFAHRAESVVGGGAITRMEEAWLRRRTTNVDSSIREDNSMIFPALPGTSIVDVEFGRRNSFFTHYVGKEYPTNRHREVLSMGAEALFGGSWSGLMGIDGATKADHDHRAFVLGIFASA